MAAIRALECSRCAEQLSPASKVPQTVCPRCAGPLLVRYDLDGIAKRWSRESLAGRVASMWRYAEVLPEGTPVTLGEGFTPLLAGRRYPGTYVKDESLNPTASFKARGFSAAITAAREMGIRKVVAPSAGNAAGALAAYCAVAGIEAHVFMPQDVPLANRVECESFGAKVTLVNGTIADCARLVNERKDAEGWFEIATLKEPFRLEGKKTMGYELAEQLNWRLPDAIIFPTGGGVGVIGMWKAFDEMETLGWIGSARPKMIAVQAAGCAPLVKAWTEKSPRAEFWQNAQTLAAGLRVPKPYGDDLVLNILRESGGAAVAVSDVEIMDALATWAEEEGIFAAPEGAASLAGYRKLLADGVLRESDSVVLFNTASGYKYLDVIARRFGATPSWMAKPKSRNIGGIIQPY